MASSKRNQIEKKKQTKQKQKRAEQRFSVLRLGLQDSRAVRILVIQHFTIGVFPFPDGLLKNKPNQKKETEKKPNQKQAEQRFSALQLGLLDSTAVRILVI